MVSCHGCNVAMIFDLFVVNRGGKRLSLCFIFSLLSGKWYTASFLIHSLTVIHITAVYKMRIVQFSEWMTWIIMGTWYTHNDSLIEIEGIFIRKESLDKKNRYRIVKLSRYQSNYVFFFTNVYVYLYIYVGKKHFRINFK